MIRSDIGLYFAPLIDLTDWVQTLTCQRQRVLPQKKGGPQWTSLAKFLDRPLGFTWPQVLVLPVPWVPEALLRRWSRAAQVRPRREALQRARFLEQVRA